MSEWLKIIAAFVAVMLASVVFKEHRKKIYGAGLYHLLNWYFDNPIWISVELKWGWEGVKGMIVAAVILNMILLIYYRNKQARWILWDALYAKKEKQDVYRSKLYSWQEKKNIQNFVYFIFAYISAQIFSLLQHCLRIKKIGKPLVFLTLCVIEDPFIATTFIRQRRKEVNHIEKEDAAIFAISLIVSIGYWAIRNGLITELFFRPILKV